MKNVKKQMKNRRSLTVVMALLIVTAMCVCLLGCGESYDPTGLVKANLDYMTTGELTDEILSETDQTEEELQKIYDEDLDGAVDLFVQQIQAGADIEVTDEMRASIEEFIIGAMKKAKYEVKEEFTEEDGVYYVDVDVYPMDFMKTAEEWIAGESYLDEWEEKITSGEYEFTTEEKLIEDVYYYMFDKITGFAEETGYLDPVTITVKVQEKDGIYSPADADLEAVGTAILGE